MKKTGMKKSILEDEKHPFCEKKNLFWGRINVKD
jgi:hypothetical protein